jgi:hypothetical protein
VSEHLIHALITVALVVVVPLALALDLSSRWVGRAAAAVGAVAATSFVFSPGPLAAASVLPWLLMAVVLAAIQVRRQPGWSAPAVARVVASAYMVVGAGWLVLSRFGARPLRFSDAIVELTAVHFHYAGFVAPVLTIQLISWMQRRERAGVSLAHFALGAILIGMPITSLGFVVAPVYGTVGAALLATGLTAVSVVTLAIVVPHVARPAGIALGISAMSVVVAMLLALAYSIGQWADLRAPSVEMMAWTHGLLNSLGFAFCGVGGWHLERRRKPGTPLP